MHSVTLCNLIEDRDTKSLRLAQSEGTIVFESAYAKKRLTALHSPDKSVYLCTRFSPICENEMAMFAQYRGIRDLAEGSKLYDLKRHHNVAGCKTQIRSYITYQ